MTTDYIPGQLYTNGTEVILCTAVYYNAYSGVVVKQTDKLSKEQVGSIVMKLKSTSNFKEYDGKVVLENAKTHSTKSKDADLITDWLSQNNTL